MRKRIILRTLAAIGFAAVVGQAVAYTIIASHSIKGTDTKRFMVQTARNRKLVVLYPNTWTAAQKSKTPANKCVFSGPEGVGLDIVISSGVVSPLSGRDGEKHLPNVFLSAAHAALMFRTGVGFSNYREDKPVPSSKLPAQSLLSLFTADKDGIEYKGFRYTMLYDEQAWSVVGYCPSRKWKEAFPVFEKMISSLEIEADGA